MAMCLAKNFLLRKKTKQENDPNKSSQEDSNKSEEISDEYQMEILVLSLLFINSLCFYYPTKNKATTTKAPITAYYITNWQDYSLPEEVSVKSLKTILERIAQYRDEEYCPFGELEDCDNRSSREVIAKIIKDIVSAEQSAKLQMQEDNSSPCDLKNQTSVRSLAMCLAKNFLLRKKTKKENDTNKSSQEDSNKSEEISDEYQMEVSDIDDKNEDKKKKKDKKHDKKSNKKKKETEKKKHRKICVDEEVKEEPGSLLVMHAYSNLKVKKHPKKYVCPIVGLV